MESPLFLISSSSFLSTGAQLKCPRSTCTNKRHSVISSGYLSVSDVDVDFGRKFSSGNFGAVFVGRYLEEANNSPMDIVVKCPVNSDLGRKLFEMERYTNNKLSKRSDDCFHVPNFVGELIIPSNVPIASGLAPLGLVWQRSGSGETLEQYLTSGRVGQLAMLLGTTSASTPLRNQLCATVLRELALIVQHIQFSGIIHRDIKPENILIVPGESGNIGSLQLIDFGSSCDWNSVLKKGLGLATCDPIYTAPEKRLDIFKPAFRFDVFSIGLIALRIALPSITETFEFQKFVENILAKSRFSLERACAAVENGRIQTSPAIRADVIALSNDSSLYSVLAMMLTQLPDERADISDCLRSRFVQFGAT